MSFLWKNIINNDTQYTICMLIYTSIPKPNTKEAASFLVWSVFSSGLRRRVRLHRASDEPTDTRLQLGWAIPSPHMLSPYIPLLTPLPDAQVLVGSFYFSGNQHPASMPRRFLLCETEQHLKPNLSCLIICNWRPDLIASVWACLAWLQSRTLC